MPKITGKDNTYTDMMKDQIEVMSGADGSQETKNLDTETPNHDKDTTAEAKYKGEEKSTDSKTIVACEVETFPRHDSRESTLVPNKNIIDEAMVSDTPRTPDENIVVITTATDQTEVMSRMDRSDDSETLETNTECVMEMSNQEKQMTIGEENEHKQRTANSSRR